MNNSKSLFLCRTPLQAKVCQAIIAAEEITDYDFIYLTLEGGDIDRSSYEVLSESASTSLYVHVKKLKVRILSELYALLKMRRFLSADYKYIYLASLKLIPFLFIIKRNRSANIFSFDDGTANILPKSFFYKKSLSYEVYIWAMRLDDFDGILKKVAKHYSIYPSFENIIPEERVKQVQLLAGRISDINFKSNSVLFIGQPFEEYLTTKEIEKLRLWLSKENIDYYIKHPRERNVLINNTEIVSPSVMLAEDVILSASKFGNVKVISSFTSVLFNLNQNDIQKIYLSVSEHQDEGLRISLAKKAGACVVTI